MPLLLRELSPDRPWAEALADLLLGDSAVPLHRTAVIVPAARAGSALQHALLERSGRDAVLLPAVLTPARLVALAAERLALPPAAPPDDLRAAALAPPLARLAWVADRAGSVTGLAEELVTLLDDLREHGLDPDDLPGDDDDPVATLDRQRLRDAWRCYRKVVAHDHVDTTRAVLAALRDPDRAALALPPWQRLVVADLVALTPLVARLLRATADRGDGVSLELAQTAPGGERVARRVLLASHADPGSPLHPFAAARRVRELLGGEPGPAPSPDPRPLRERLAAAGSLDPTAPDAPVALRPAPDPEEESRLVAALVVERLRESPDARIVVATADRSLGRRIAAQLRDAGLTDVDDSGGIPLAAHADGRLVHGLLRTVLTDWSVEPLLELLTHPHVHCGVGRGRWLAWARRFEQEVLRGQAVAASPAGYLRRAREKDRALARRGGDTRPYYTPPLERLREVLAPLSGTGSDHRDAAAWVAALREAWAAAAPDHALDGTTDPARQALTSLLNELTAASAALPPLSPGEFAALVDRRLRRTIVRPHRRPWLPVLVTGLLEARLEHADLLILAGMNQDVFPGRLPRPLLLGARWLRRHRIPTWTERLGWSGELAWRLLGGGDRVVVTWSREREGRPALPSPWVARLLLAVEKPPAPPADPVPLYRPRPPAVDVARKAQDRFAREPAAAPAWRPAPPPATIGTTALDTYLECPYRYLLTRRLGLREPESVTERLEKRDVGTLVHAALRAFLLPGATGRKALDRRDGPAAVAALRNCLAEVFDAAADLPERTLWERYYGRLAEEIVAHELARAAEGWEPARLEASFALPLARVADLLPAAERPPADAPWLGTAVTGRIDRVDVTPDGASCAVLDYKTGTPPAAKEVTAGRRLQLPVYCLAVALEALEDPLPVPARFLGHYYHLSAGKIADADKKIVTIEGDELAGWAAILLETVAGMADAERDGFSLAPRDDERREAPSCRWCRFRGVCRLDEREPAVAKEVLP